MDVKGKVVLVTGASRGIGKAVAESFSAAGADVAFTFLSSVEKALALESKLAESGSKVKGYKSDASIFSEAEDLVNQVLTDFGKIDILINNAGITRDTLLLRMTEQQWDEVINVNLKSIFNLTKAATKPMMKAKYGSIINITSVVGLMGNAGQTNYAASKAGILGFTKSVAKELGSRNIRCNAIAPGFIETEMTGELNAEQLAAWTANIPLKKAGQGIDIANACLFLGSDASAYITGQTLVVDGGLLM
jgi:3-oxoacyl-[acyl-carrier protein] reductase